MKKEFQICTVVQGKTLKSFLKKLKKAHIHASMLELRADTIEEFSIHDLSILNERIKLPSIFTLRHADEGGLYEGDLSKQKEILKKAFSLKFDYVDISYGNSILKDLTATEKKKLLISYHNNGKTPSRACSINFSREKSLEGMSFFSPHL